MRDQSDESGRPTENPYTDNFANSQPEPISNSQDQSVFAEPWVAKIHFTGDEYSDAMQPSRIPAEVEHTVWDEPGLSSELAGATPDEGLTWTRWYERESAATSVLDSWMMTVLLCVLSGPLAIATAAFGFHGSAFDFVMILFVIPAAEELLKVMLPLWVVERRPYLFIAPFQILLCTACSGLIFGAMHHLFAVKLFGIGSSSGGTTVLTVSMFVHLICSLIAGAALVRIWSKSAEAKQKPDLTHGGALGSAAIGLRIVYSAVLIGLGIV